ncbi:hypothetical protein [Pseudoxanthomonas mexicana]|uniref:hypothetical protein n=1 Tax=Pseudoxanthomonas mexicana TaxID=128785 RepID=UPI00398ABDF4
MALAPPSRDRWHFYGTQWRIHEVPEVMSIASHARYGPSLDGTRVLISFTLNRYIVDHLLRTMRHFDLDLDSVVIWSLLAQLNVVHLIPPGATPDVVLGEDGHLVREGRDMRAMRLRDLEQISLLPRETIRRKLAKLEERGLVCRTDAGWTMAQLYVDENVRQFVHEQAKRASVLCKELNRILSCSEGLADRPVMKAPSRGDRAAG